MSTEYREHYEWAKKDLYTREGKHIGLHYPEPVNYLNAVKEWKPLKVQPESEDIMTERMKKEFGAYKSSLIKKKTSTDENVFLTSYQTTFKPEYNYRPSFSTYENAAKKYAKEVDQDVEDESDFEGRNISEENVGRAEDRKGICDPRNQEEKEDQPDNSTTLYTNEKAKVEQEFLGANELAQAAMEMIKTDFSKGKMWNLCNLPLVDAKERYHRYREYLDKSPNKKLSLNKIYHC